MSKRAVVLFNLGGPDRPEAVAPFLRNLFSDHAIIGLPQPFRWLVASLIARRRTPIAEGIFAKIGGASPLLANTERQARALEQTIGGDVRVFIAMRYWRPFVAEVAKAVKDWAPDEIVLLPLYPQASATTTKSSFSDWHRAAAMVGLRAPTRALCCYPEEPGWIAALVENIGAALRHWPAGIKRRVLFSAHGLPKRIVASGDPYQWQVERTVAAIRRALALPDLDSAICYQSRVGRLAWIGPATDEEIRRAGREGKGLLIVPVAFVSEHSETLVELDIEYRHLAESVGVPHYVRVATVGAAPQFIAGLAQLVAKAAQQAPGAVCSAESGRICPPAVSRCLWGSAA